MRQSQEYLPQYRIPLREIAGGRLVPMFKGRFDAWAFRSTTERAWLHSFRERVVDSIGRRYLPVYRIADGEFRYLLGRRVRWQSEHPIRDGLGVAAERLGLIHRTNATSWGEEYSPSLRIALRRTLTDRIRSIAQSGYLATLLSDNGVSLAHEYRAPFCKYMAYHDLCFGSNNYVPFHFVCELLSSPGWEELLEGRRVLIVTSLEGKNTALIAGNLTAMGVRDIQFVNVSANHSMLDNVNLSTVRMPVDLCLVSAGVGSANVLVQLKALETTALDIGGYLYCFENKAFVAHGVFRSPERARA